MAAMTINVDILVRLIQHLLGDNLQAKSQLDALHQEFSKQQINKAQFLDLLRISMGNVVCTQALEIICGKQRLKELYERKMKRSRAEIQQDPVVNKKSKPHIPNPCYCHQCKYEVLCQPNDLPEDKKGPINFVPKSEKKYVRVGH